MSRKYEIDMLKGNYFRKLAIFAFPLMLSSVLQLLFNAADIAVVGKFAGDNSLAAVSSTSSLVNLCVNLFIGLSIGTNIITARMLGEGNDEDISKVVHTSIALAVYFGIFLSVFGFLFAKGMLLLMDTPSNILDLSALYLKIYFLGMPANLVYNFGAALLRSKGDTRRPLYYLTCAGIANVILNIVFVVFFKMDVVGVALATVASQIISAYLVINCLMNETDSLVFHPGLFGIDFKMMLEILKVGVPCGVQGTVFAISNVVIQSTVNSFGSTIMAGNGAASNLEGFIYTATNAFGQAGQTFIGQNYGAKKLDNIYRIMGVTIAYVLIVGLFMSYGMYYFGPFFLGIYSNSAEVIEAGMIRMADVLRYYYIDSLMCCLSSILRGLGYVTLPTVNSLLMVCGVRLLWVATFFKLNPVIHNLYIIYPISWILVSAVHLLTIVFVLPKVKRHCLK